MTMTMKSASVDYMGRSDTSGTGAGRQTERVSSTGREWIRQPQQPAGRA